MNPSNSSTNVSRSSHSSRGGGAEKPINGPHFEQHQEFLERLRELEAGGTPLSIPEQLAGKISDVESIAAASSQNDDASPEPINITRLRGMSLAELVDYAAEVGVGPSDEQSHQELLFEIIKHRVQTRGMMYGEGTLEILPDGFGFLRSSKFHYLSCSDDIYVSPSQIRRFRLKTGAIVGGYIRPPKEKERYFALLRIHQINGRTPEENSQLPSFDDLTPIHPSTRVVMEQKSSDLSSRIVDLFAPIGFGQRGLIVSPPRAGKTMLMQAMARSVLANYPDAYVFVLLIDERPEEVTDMEREVHGERCEVISSTFDESTQRHVQVSEMVLDKAKRMVENGVDVVIFLDSITRLSRAWNQECPDSGKTLSGGLDANAMQRPKAFFGSARKVEEGGSLTILATALVDTGSKMDDVIYEEFKGTGNLEIVLDRSLVERRIWPAIDINVTGTRREERLFSPEEYRQISALRRSLCELNAPNAMETLLKRLQKTSNNQEFLSGFADQVF